MYVQENYLKLKLMHLAFYTGNKQDKISFVDVDSSERVMNGSAQFLDDERYEKIRNRVNDLYNDSF